MKPIVPVINEVVDESAAAAASAAAPSAPPAAPAALTLEEKRARVAEAARRKEAEDEVREVETAFTRLELRERFEKELGGPEGQQFMIHDATDVGEGFFVVKLAPSIVYKTYWDSKNTDVDRCDFVKQCVVYPAVPAYLAARGRRQGIDAVLADMLALLNGLKSRAESGK